MSRQTSVKGVLFVNNYNMYDIAIIGGGPAGYSAAINAKILNRSYIWFTGKTPPKKVIKAELIRNYLGLSDISGENLFSAFESHIAALGVEKTPEVVTGVYDLDGKYALLAGKNEYEARTVILCTGVETARPIDGEDEFLGRGVSYCATCDGNFYRGKDIAVLCYDKAFEHEIEYLCTLAHTVHVIPTYKDCGVKAANAHMHEGYPVKFTGGMRLEKVLFKNGELAVDGVFVLRNSFSPAKLVHGLKTEGGHIVVNRALATNLDGVFAAGDCAGRPYQYAKSAGEGNIAVHSAVEYLSK